MKRNFTLTTLTMVFTLIAITFFLVYDRTLKGKCNQELFLLLFHFFFLTVVLADLELIDLRIYITEQDRKMARRDDLQRMEPSIRFG